MVLITSTPQTNSYILPPQIADALEHLSTNKALICLPLSFLHVGEARSLIQWHRLSCQIFHRFSLLFIELGDATNLTLEKSRWPHYFSESLLCLEYLRGGASVIGSAPLGLLTSFIHSHHLPNHTKNTHGHSTVTIAQALNTVLLPAPVIYIFYFYFFHFEMAAIFGYPSI